MVKTTIRSIDKKYNNNGGSLLYFFSQRGANRNSVLSESLGGEIKQYKRVEAIINSVYFYGRQVST